MKQILNILAITADKLKKGDYKLFLPELYNLRLIIENNLWHSKQNAFDHTVAVFRSLEKIFRFDFLTDLRKKEIIEQYLKTKVGRYSRKELLMIATILHDIAKTDTLIKDSSDFTSCPDHEIIGSFMVDAFSDRFNLDVKGKEQVAKIIHYHGFISSIMELALAKENAGKYFDLFRKIVGDNWRELIIFMYADLSGSDLKKSAPASFAVREKLLVGFLDYL